jgi:hypothetical protein
MSEERHDLSAISLIAYLDSARQSLDERQAVSFSGPLADAYHSVTRELYDEDNFDSTASTLLRATQLAEGDGEMLAMLGEGPLKSWLTVGGSRVLKWSREQAEQEASWRDALRAVTLSYRPEVEAELRALVRYVRAVWDLPAKN